jgi:hypothetical protein
MKNLLILLVLLTVISCGSKKEEENVILPEGQMDLLVDDGQGVIFTSKTATSAVQFKLYNNVLREVVNTDTNPACEECSFSKIPTDVYLYNVVVRGTTYSKITCNQYQTLELEVVDWDDVLTTTNLAIAEDFTFKCFSGETSFDLKVFTYVNKIRPDMFAGYFDFVNKSFRGKIVITDLSYTEYDHPESSTVVWFE